MKSELAIVKKDTPILPSFKAPQREIAVAARRGMKVVEILKDDAGIDLIVIELEAMTEKANIVGGFKQGVDLDSKEKGILMDEFVKVLEGYKWLTLEELRLVFSKGLRGDLGDTFGWNPKALNTWIKNYHTERQSVLRDQLAYETEERFKREEKDRDARRRADAKYYTEKFIAKYNELLEKGIQNVNEIPDDIDPYNVWYMIFERHGIILIDNDKKLKIKKIVEREMRNEGMKYYTHITTLNRRKANNDFEIEVKRRCRQLAFKRQVSILLKNKADIRQLFIETKIYEPE